MRREITPEEREAYRLLYEAAKRLKAAQRRATRKRANKSAERPEEGRCSMASNVRNIATAPTGADDTPRLALRPRDAARALGIGERKLWEMTNRGEIPCVRIGRCVTYPVDLLREWLTGQAEGGRV